MTTGLRQALSAVRPAMPEKELRRLAIHLSTKLSADADYREDLIQVAMIGVLKKQAATPDMPSALASTVMFREMLKQMERDRVNNRQKNYRPRALSFAEVWPDATFEPGRRDETFERSDTRIEVAALLASLPVRERRVLEAMLRNDCGPTAAGQSLGLTESSTRRAFTAARHRLRTLFPEAVAA